MGVLFKNAHDTSLSLPLIVSMHLLIHFDGGCDPNPGRGYGSFEIRYLDQVVRSAIKEDYGSPMTNNQAEYLALIRALSVALSNYSDIEPLTVEIRTDSRLVVEQIKKRWRCKNKKLVALRDQCWSLLSEFAEWQIQWNTRLVNVEKFGH